jgi:hypothetical protein
MPKIPAVSARFDSLLQNFDNEETLQEVDALPATTAEDAAP